MKRWFLLVVLCMLPATGLVAAETAAPKALTVMVYMCGSSLETMGGSATADIDEMLQSNFDADKVNLVVMAGGSRRWDKGLRSGESGVVEFFKKRGELKCRVVRARPDVNMGDPRTLADFMQESVLLYPAREYALILWDHGNGPLEGVCMDELNEPDRITLHELAEALEAAELPQKLSWIGFDACLMGTVEVASAVAPYAEYMVASQAEEPSTGWNYSFLKGIELNFDAVGTGTRIVDAYFEANADSAGEINLSCIDLSAIVEITDRMNAMFSDLAALLNPESFSRFSSLRTDATGFGRERSALPLSGDSDLVDVVSLCDCFAEIAPEGARRVRDAITQGVRYSRARPENCFGLSAYHPFRNRQKYLSEWKSRYEALNFCPGYTRYVKAYGGIMAGDQLVSWTDLGDISAMELDMPGEAGTFDAPADGSSVISLRLSPEQAANLAGARLVVLAHNIYDHADDAYFRVYSTPDVSIDGTLITAVFDGRYMQITDASAQNDPTGFVDYRVSEDGAYLLDIYPIEADGSRWERPVLAEYEMTPSGELEFKSYSVYDETLGTYSMRVKVDFDAFQSLAILNECRVPAYSDAQERLGFDAWQVDAHTDVQWKTDSRIYFKDFRPVFWRPVITEDLYAAYELTDTQGNVYMSDLARLNGESVRYYSHETVPGMDFPMLEADFDASWEDGCIWWELYVENTSDAPRHYLLEDIVVNGVPMEEALLLFSGGENGSYILTPGGVGCFFTRIDAQALNGVSIGDVLEQVEACLVVLSDSDDAMPMKIQFSASPMLNAQALYRVPGSEGANQRLEDVPIQLLDSGEDGVKISTQVILRTAERSANCGIIANVVLENRTSRSVDFALRRVAMNGVAVSDIVWNAKGSGEHGSLAPGERLASNIELNQAHIAAIAPDVSLKRLDFLLVEYQYIDGASTKMNVIPLTMNLDIPLDCFYRDAETLPSQALIDTGRTVGALDARTAQTMYESDTCDIALQGLYLVNRSAVLLLRCENRSDAAQSVFLGQASLGGVPAATGGNVGAIVAAHNNQARAFGRRLSMWPQEKGVRIDLKPGAVEYHYVGIAPVSKDQVEADDIALRAYMYPTGNPLDYVYFGEARVCFSEPGPLAEGFESVAPMEDLAITPGRPETRAQAAPLFADQVRMPEGDLTRNARLLSLELAEGERLKKGYYVLFRRVRGYGDLAAMNLFIMDREPLPNSAMHTFAGGEGMLLYQAYGSLTPAADGHAATARFPGLLPVAESGGEQLPLTIFYIGEGDDGGITFDQDSNSLGFRATAFPDATLNTMAYNLALAVYPESGRGELRDCALLNPDAAGILRGMVYQSAYLCPADADEQALIDFIQDNGRVELNQMQPMDGPTLQLAMSPIEDPDDYCVAFLYVTTDGEVKCTGPLPLSDYS